MTKTTKTETTDLCRVVWNDAKRAIHGDARRAVDYDVRIAAILLGSMVWGPNADRLATKLKLPREFARQIGKKCRRAGIWRARKIYADWLGENGLAAVIMDTLVIKGQLKRTR